MDRKNILYISPLAQQFHDKMEISIKNMINKYYKSCLHEEFKSCYFELLELFDAFQKEVVSSSGEKISCTKGCSICCNHWADEVYSFEAEILSDYIIKQESFNINDIIEILKQDENQFYILQNLVNRKLSENHDDCKGIDPRDLLLSCFYQLYRPCPFLDENGACAVHHVRPIICRSYLNLGDVINCHPDNINEMIPMTLILSFDEKAGSLLEQLHEQYNCFGDDRNLRSLVRKYLEKMG